MATYYNSDLARVHDQDFCQLAKDAAYFIKSQTQGMKVLDLGCGTGTLAKILSEAGFQVTGVDYSLGMLEIARSNVPTVTFVQNSIFDFEIPPSDVVSLIGEVLCYLFDHHKSDTDSITRLFEEIYAKLNEQGILLFDFLTPDVVTDGHLAKRIIERENWSMFVALDKDANHEILTRDLTIFYREDHLYRRSHEIHRQRLYNPERIQQILDRIGFSVEILDSYGDERFRTGHVGMLCRK